MGLIRRSILRVPERAAVPVRGPDSRSSPTCGYTRSTIERLTRIRELRRELDGGRTLMLDTGVRLREL
jgi:hypothetical protein